MSASAMPSRMKAAAGGPRTHAQPIPGGVARLEPLGSDCRIRKGEQRDDNLPSSLALVPGLEMAWQDVDNSFERFCLTAGIGALEQMLCEDAQRLVGAPHSRGVGHRWGRTKEPDRAGQIFIEFPSGAASNSTIDYRPFRVKLA
jgi:hypothetical protein